MAMCLHTQSAEASVWGHSSQVCSLAGTVCCLGVWNGTFLPVIFSKWWRLGVSVYAFYERNGFNLAYNSRNLLLVEELLQVHKVQRTLLWWISHVSRNFKAILCLFLQHVLAEYIMSIRFLSLSIWLFEPVTNRPRQNLWTFYFLKFPLLNLGSCWLLETSGSSSDASNVAAV